MSFRDNYYQTIGIIPQNLCYKEDPLYSMYHIKKEKIDVLSMHNGDNFGNNKINFHCHQDEFKFNLEHYFKKPCYQMIFSDHVGLFVFDLNHNLYVTPSIKSNSKQIITGHIDLSLGANCLCAGTLYFDKNGILSEIALDSGHYRPTYFHGMYFLNFLFKKYILSQSILPSQGLLYFKPLNIKFFFKNDDQAIKSAFHRLDLSVQHSTKSMSISINANPYKKNNFVSKTLSFKDFITLLKFV
jgi:hypothetical protein